MSYKICTKCHKKRHKTKSFPKDNSKPDGYYSSCKDCYRERIGSKKRVPKVKVRRDGSIFRWCGSCKKYKEAWKFYKNKFMKDGVHSACKTCSIERSRSEISKLGLKGRRQADRVRIIDHYTKGKRECACCGERQIRFLCVDHVNGGGSKHRKAVGHVDRWLIRNNFPGGFQILCHNCNMAKGFYGKCPHNEKNK